MVEDRLMPKRVAVAIAVYNEARYLSLALDALCRQSYRDFEIALLDDGSEDGTPALAEGYVDRLPLRLIRADHRGRQLAKQAAWNAASGGEYLLVLDGDIALPDDGLERMVAMLDADPTIAAVSAQARADIMRPFGAAQAFLEDLFFRSNADAEGNGRWIVGGCVLLRRSALAELDVRNDVGEDNDLSQKLREAWRLVVPGDLVATHYGVPTSASGVFRRFLREGVRVRALLRVYPEARQLGNVARLVPLPLVTGALLGAASGQLWLTAGAAAVLAAYVAAFLYASRGVAARPSDRLAGALLFTFGNIGFGIGYLQEALRRGATGVLNEPGRSY